MAGSRENKMDYKVKKAILFPMNILFRINPIFETKMMFFLKNGYKLNLKHPITFNEKIQWIKFFDHNSRMPACSDKFEVRNYITECGCCEILNSLLWEGFEPEDIPFEELPNQFVIKVTHGSSFNVICKDKQKLDIGNVKKNISFWLKESYLPCYGEWFYGIVKPRIIIEEYLEGKDGGPPQDYKVYCFHGVPKVIQVHIDRFNNHKMKLYDTNWNAIQNVSMKYSCDTQTEVEKPQELAQLLKYASILSSPFYHARVDFYIVKGNIIFGEITFTDGAGFDKITPYSFDVTLGGFLTLPVD